MLMVDRATKPISGWNHCDNGLGLSAMASAMIGDTMIHIYRITKSPEVGEVVDSIEAAETFARDLSPGRYSVDEHSLDPFPGTKVSARAWGKVIHHKNGDVVVDPFTWL